MAVVLQQFDTAGLKLYYGSNAPVLADGFHRCADQPDSDRCAFLAVFEDGDNVFAFYAPKAEIYRADDLTLSAPRRWPVCRSASSR
jgi:hypothetical protein